VLSCRDYIGRVPRLFSVVLYWLQSPLLLSADAVTVASSSLSLSLSSLCALGKCSKSLSQIVKQQHSLLFFPIFFCSHCNVGVCFFWQNRRCLNSRKWHCGWGTCINTAYVCCNILVKWVETMEILSIQMWMRLWNVKICTQCTVYVHGTG
jgi:hypothetical protein